MIIVEYSLRVIILYIKIEMSDIDILNPLPLKVVTTISFNKI